MDTTIAKHLMAGQRVRIEGPGTVKRVDFDAAGEQVNVTWRPDGQQADVVSPIPREHHVKHAD